jgi:hypothetical protein
MKMQDFQSFSEFWPYYLSQHSKVWTRRLHFIGFTNLICWLIVAVVVRSWLALVFAVGSSYGFAWIGHFFVEKNIPATFWYPVKANLGVALMYYKMLRGTLDEDLEKYLGSKQND